ncbi:hypothetical protein TSUD_308750 [Trifolium subterraneum]|nr:hypothetical protein TSUD_308750 [Trifolium subterraneum]
MTVLINIQNLVAYCLCLHCCYHNLLKNLKTSVVASCCYASASAAPVFVSVAACCSASNIAAMISSLTALGVTHLARSPCPLDWQPPNGKKRSHYSASAAPVFVSVAAAIQLKCLQYCCHANGI